MRYPRPTTLWVGLLFATLLTGCATQPVSAPQSTSALAAARWQQHRDTLQTLHRFTLQARIASNGTYGISGTLLWQQMGGHFTMHFSGPFGFSAIEVEGTLGNVEIRIGKKHYHTSNPEAFLNRYYGWTLPVIGLRFWVLGVSSPGSSAKVRYNNNGRAIHIAQDGWVIHYGSYQNGGGYALPRYFTLLAGKKEFRIIVDHWSNIAPSPATAK